MVRIGIIGCGEISKIYLKNLITVFKEVEVTALCDLSEKRLQDAKAYALKLLEETGEEKTPDLQIFLKAEDLVHSDKVDIVLVLTRPAQHYAMIKLALNAGKHAYTEKPLALSLEDAKELAELAEEKKLCLGGAPDTFLGAGIQTCRKLIEDGVIGDVIGAGVSMVCRGHESWHPDPDFYYQYGGGPVMDMGPYYITALVNLLGEAKAVSAMSKRSFSERIITSSPKAGEKIPVDVDTFVSGNILFESGAIARVFMTFDVFYKKQSSFEIYGTKGTLVVPDPNTFHGPVLLYRPEDDEFGPSVDPGLLPPVNHRYESFKEVPLMFDYRDNFRGLGLADMAKALETGRAYRADSKLQLHVLDIMKTFEKASESGKTEILSTGYSGNEIMENYPVRGIL